MLFLLLGKTPNLSELEFVLNSSHMLPGSMAGGVAVSKTRMTYGNCCQNQPVVGVWACCLMGKSIVLKTFGWGFSTPGSREWVVKNDTQRKVN